MRTRATKRDGESSEHNGDLSGDYTLKRKSRATKSTPYRTRRRAKRRKTGRCMQAAKKSSGKRQTGRYETEKRIQGPEQSSGRLHPVSQDLFLLRDLVDNRLEKPLEDVEKLEALSLALSSLQAVNEYFEKHSQAAGIREVDGHSEEERAHPTNQVLESEEEDKGARILVAMSKDNTPIEEDEKVEQRQSTSNETWWSLFFGERKGSEKSIGIEPVCS
ncbi:MAG: hypothetical protein Q9188_001291 [Gyalolechia gomerana]